MSYRDEYIRIQQDPSASDWLKRAMVDLSRRDPVDAANDTDALRALCMMRVREAGEAAAPLPNLHLFTPEDTITGSGLRVEMALNDADHAKIQRGRPWEAVVTDQLTGRMWHVRGAECAAGKHCFCAAELVKEVKAHDVEIPVEGQEPIRLRLYQNPASGRIGARKEGE